MTSIANITVASNSVELEDGHGQHVFTITNTCSETLTYGVKAEPDDPRQKVWFKIDGPNERQLADRQSDQISVDIKADPDVATGKYTFHLLAYSTRNPGEDFTKSPTVAFVVKEHGTAHKNNQPPPPAKSWLPVIALATGIVAVVLSLITFFYLFQDVKSVRQELADSMGILGKNIPGIENNVNNFLNDITQVKEDIIGLRQELSAGNVRVYTAGGTSAMALLSDNNWADFPELNVKFEVDKDAYVIAYYQITTASTDSTLVTRLFVDKEEQTHARSISGNQAYWSPASLWSDKLAKGEHTITVQYRTPAGGTNYPANNDWHNRALTVIVLGS